MNRIFVTGFSGFVGNHLCTELNRAFPGVRVYGADLQEPPFRESRGPHEFLKIDMLQQAELISCLEKIRPDCVIHLASFSSVARSWDEPQRTFYNNTNIYLNLLEAVRTTKTKARILSIGSSEEYGLVKSEELPIKETNPLRPTSPYAVARVSQEMLSKLYVDAFDFDIVSTRSFNHIGRGQKPLFFVPSIVGQFVDLADRPEENRELAVGNLDVVRDFLDVEDVVRAYSLLLQSGGKGEIYNVCSGQGHQLRRIVDLMQAVSGTKVRISVDPQLLRPVENPVILGSHDKLTLATGWKPSISLEMSLQRIYDWMKSERSSS